MMSRICFSENERILRFISDKFLVWFGSSKNIANSPGGIASCRMNIK